MPITKSATKKMRRDRKKTVINRRTQTDLLSRIKSFRLKPTVEALPQVYSSLDEAAKRHLIHPKRADRLKSRLSRLVPASS